VRDGRSFELLAPAKVNLRLKVLGRRSDGYHLLSMLNASTTLYDNLKVRYTDSAEVRVVVEPPAAVDVSSDNNLVSKAFRAFWDVFGFEQAPIGLEATLVKRIPVGGGLGGGSSDAGALLRSLSEQFGAQLRGSLSLLEREYTDRVGQAALRCGADVPYAYHGGWCWVTGVGERIQPLGGGNLWPGELLLVVPPVPVATGPFYDYFRRHHPVIPERPLDEPMERFCGAPSSEALPELVQNDFERDAVSMVPLIGEGLERARAVFPRGTALTGSGSAFFSLIPLGGEGRAMALTAELEALGMTVRRTRLN